MLDDNGVALNSSILSRGTACFSCCSLYPRIYLTVKTKNIEFMQCLWIPNKKVLPKKFLFLKEKARSSRGKGLLTELSNFNMNLVTVGIGNTF